MPARRRLTLAMLVAATGASSCHAPDTLIRVGKWRGGGTEVVLSCDTFHASSDPFRISWSTHARYELSVPGSDRFLASLVPIEGTADGAGWCLENPAELGGRVLTDLNVVVARLRTGKEASIVLFSPGEKPSVLGWGDIAYIDGSVKGILDTLGSTDDIVTRVLKYRYGLGRLPGPLLTPARIRQNEGDLVDYVGRECTSERQAQMISGARVSDANVQTVVGALAPKVLAKILSSDATSDCVPEVPLRQLGTLPDPSIDAAVRTALAHPPEGCAAMMALAFEVGARHLELERDGAPWLRAVLSSGYKRSLPSPEVCYLAWLAAADVLRLVDPKATAKALVADIRANTHGYGVDTSAWWASDPLDLWAHHPGDHGGDAARDEARADAQVLQRLALPAARDEVLALARDPKSARDGRALAIMVASTWGPLGDLDTSVLTEDERTALQRHLLPAGPEPTTRPGDAARDTGR